MLCLYCHTKLLRKDGKVLAEMNRKRVEWGKFKKKKISQVVRTSLMAQRLRFYLPMQGVWISPLVGELKSHKPHSQKVNKQKNIRSNTVTNLVNTLKMAHIKYIYAWRCQVPQFENSSQNYPQDSSKLDNTHVLFYALIGLTASKEKFRSKSESTCLFYLVSGNKFQLFWIDSVLLSLELTSRTSFSALLKYQRQMTIPNSLARLHLFKAHLCFSFSLWGPFGGKKYSWSKCWACCGCFDFRKGVI